MCFEYFACVCVCAPRGTQYSWTSEESIGFPGVELWGSHECWERNPGPLREHEVLLNPEPSLQPQGYLLNTPAYLSYYFFRPNFLPEFIPCNARLLCLLPFFSHHCKLQESRGFCLFCLPFHNYSQICARCAESPRYFLEIMNAWARGFRQCLSCL